MKSEEDCHASLATG